MCWGGALGHFVVQQKSKEHSKSTTPQLKKERKKERKGAQKGSTVSSGASLSLQPTTFCLLEPPGPSVPYRENVTRQKLQELDRTGFESQTHHMSVEGRL